MSTDEALRLQELHQYNILFTDPEPAFDRITNLAKRLFGVPIVLISLVDKDFQWFKSCIGLNASSTSREVSFCQHTLTRHETLVVSDATLDPRFAHNPLVTGPPAIRFYAGAPLVSPRGFGLGALCIIDTVPHPAGLHPDQRKILTDLAAMVVSELEFRSANELSTSVRLSLERSNEELTRFAHVVSHDLQTPVRTIASFTQLLRKRLKALLNEDEDQQFELISDAAMRMGELISALLKYAEAGQGRVNLQDISTEEILGAAMLNLESAINENGAEIVYTSLPVVNGDRIQIGQLFQNLIANALKYRSPDRTPRIEIDCQRLDASWQFRIEDNGLGIADKYRDEIFEPLTRLHGSEISGTGMGLAICRSIVNRHGGNISVTSKLGSGTSFCFTLPLPAA